MKSSLERETEPKRLIRTAYLKVRGLVEPLSPEQELEYMAKEKKWLTNLSTTSSQNHKKFPLYTGPANPSIPGSPAVTEYINEMVANGVIDGKRIAIPPSIQTEAKIEGTHKYLTLSPHFLENHSRVLGTYMSSELINALYVILETGDKLELRIIPAKTRLLPEVNYLIRHSGLAHFDSVIAAGTISLKHTGENKQLPHYLITEITNASGHYRPSKESLSVVYNFLKEACAENVRILDGNITGRDSEMNDVTFEITGKSPKEQNARFDISPTSSNVVNGTQPPNARTSTKRPLDIADFASLPPSLSSSPIKRARTHRNLPNRSSSPLLLGLDDLDLDLGCLFPRPNTPTTSAGPNYDPSDVNYGQENSLSRQAITDR